MNQVEKIKGDSVGYKRERIYMALNHGAALAQRVQPCHIAHVLRTLNLTTRVAHNRISADGGVKDCPADLWPMVEEAVRHVHAAKLNG